MVDWATTNTRKIKKALYLILERYHRSHGLAVMAWEKAPGNCYYSFYSLAVRDVDGRPRHLPEVHGRYSLTIYQDHPGLPAWGASEQLEHEEWRERELRSGKLFEWYLERLTLSPFFTDYASEITRWRGIYTVAKSEPFLFTWNVLGLYAAQSGLRIGTYDRSDAGGGLAKAKRLAGGAFDVLRPDESVHLCGNLAFCTDGRVLLPDGEVTDIWQEHLAGREASAIVDHLSLLAG